MTSNYELTHADKYALALFHMALMQNYVSLCRLITPRITYTHTHIYTYIHVRAHTHIHTHTHTHTHTHIGTHIFS